MTKVHLIHWNDDELAARVTRLERAGFTVSTAPSKSLVSSIRAAAPEVLVVDLSRLPAQGVAIAAMIRQTKWGRALPVVFVDGAPEKVERARTVLPDATYTAWAKVKSAVREALAAPAAKPVVPKRLFAASTVPLAKKLAIRPNTTVVLLDAPGSFEDQLGELPEGVTLRDRGRGDLVVWFLRAAEDLERDIERVFEQAGASPVWMAWRKRTADPTSELTSNLVLDVGRAMGRVDSKVCAIDDVWSAMMFCVPAAKAPKRAPRG